MPIRCAGSSAPRVHTSILNAISKSLEEDKNKNQKVHILAEVYSEIKMNSKGSQRAIDTFIDCVDEISQSINSEYWSGEDVMGIFFNEFNRYKAKSDSGQVFTPEHITSLMYRLIDVDKDSRFHRVSIRVFILSFFSMSNTPSST